MPQGCRDDAFMALSIEARFLKKIGRKIGEVRFQKGYTQLRLAEKANVSIQMVQYWESGHNLTLKTLMRISRSLNCGVAALMENPDGVSPAKRGRPPGFSGK